MKSALKYLSLTIFTILALGKFPAMAQENCTDALKKAQRLYNEGVIEKIEDQLKTCLETSFTHEQKLEALKLIILANLYDEKVEEAEANMLKFLELEPEYEVNPASDPEEFANLFTTYHTSPLWSFGGFFGPSFIRVKQLEEYGTYNTQVYDYDKFKGHIFSFNAGARVSRYLAKDLEAQGELMFEQDKFIYSILVDYNTIIQEETHINITLPLSVTYDFLKTKKLCPFVRLGGSFSYLMRANADLSRNYEDGSANIDESSTINLNDLRRKVSVTALAGIGAKFKVKRANIVLDLRYRYGLNNLVNTKNRYIDSKENYDRIFNIHQVDDDFSIDKFCISVAYMRNIYKPRKKTKKPLTP